MVGFKRYYFSPFIRFNSSSIHSKRCWSVGKPAYSVAGF
uniref:Uncharacterized protein n=1 Tax=Anguilla anguilla TaxID=7936 RepID=A0A0E9UWV4_ANGAN